MMEKQTPRNSSMVTLDKLGREPIPGWQDFLKEGRQFLSTADRGFAGKRQLFTGEILYNLIAMAIEKLIMAMLMQSSNLPYNHTMGDLVEAMEEFLPGKLTAIGEDLKALDRFQEICDIDSYSIKSPTLKEVEKMLDLGHQVQALALEQTSVRGES